MRAVADMGFEEASPIQAKSIPVQLEGVDMSLVTRSKDASLQTESKRMEIEQFHAITLVYRNRFFGV